MRKSRDYKGLRFTSEAIKKIFSFFDRCLLTDYHRRYEVKELTTEMCGIVWEHYSDEAMYNAYIPWVTNITYKKTFLDYEFMLFTHESSTFIGLKAHNLMQIQPIFEEIDKNIPDGTVTWQDVIPHIRPYIILAHGKGDSWRSLADYLYVRHGYALRCYEFGNSGSKGLNRIITDSVPENIMALVIFEQSDIPMLMHPEIRKAILSDLDYFESTLGTERVLCVKEYGLSLPFWTGAHDWLVFRSGHIKEVFLQIAGKIRGEFRSR